MDFTNARIIHTGLFSDCVKEILDAVDGQLSDGKWENCRGYEKYWLNFNVVRADDGEVIFKVNANASNWYYTKYVSNPFCGMPDDEFKVWIAKKIKAVINTEAKDDNWENGWWNRRDTWHNSIYLNRDIDITVADIYCTYEALLGREIGVIKYDASTIAKVFGNKRTDTEIAAAREKNEKAKAAREAYDSGKKQLDDEEKEMIESIKKTFADKREALRKTLQDSLAKIEAA